MSWPKFTYRKPGQRIPPPCAQGEVFPVDREMVPEAFRHARLRQKQNSPACDLQKLYKRLLTGEEKLWLCVRTDREPHDIVASFTTRVTATPPSLRHYFRKKRSPEQLRSLTVHIYGGKFMEAWLPSAIDRVTTYGLEEGCRQLFLLSPRGLRGRVMRFYKPDLWDVIAWARDRQTRAGGAKLSQRPFFYRPVIRSANPPANPHMRYEMQNWTYCK